MFVIHYRWCGGGQRKRAMIPAQNSRGINNDGLERRPIQLRLDVTLGFPGSQRLAAFLLFAGKRLTDRSQLLLQTIT